MSWHSCEPSGTPCKDTLVVPQYPTIRKPLYKSTHLVDYREVLRVEGVGGGVQVGCLPYEHCEGGGVPQVGCQVDSTGIERVKKRQHVGNSVLDIPVHTQQLETKNERFPTIPGPRAFQTGPSRVPAPRAFQGPQGLPGFHGLPGSPGPSRVWESRAPGSQLLQGLPRCGNPHEPLNPHLVNSREGLPSMP
jgi:hypothetical protein